MKPERQRIAIAESRGWNCFGMFNGNPHQPAAFPSGVNTKPAPLPDYLNDLNAINEVLRSMESRYWLPFLRALIKITKTDLDPNSLTSIMLQVTATADQLSEAYLKAIGKWEES